MTVDHVEGMRGSVRKLMEAYEICSTEGFPIEGDGDFEFVANLFFEMQAEHLRAATTLLRTKNFLSLKVLGRTMFEGMVLLLWINGKRDERAMKWRAWSSVTNWRLLREKDAAGVSVEASERKRVEERITQFGHLFLRSKPKNDDPYVYSWTRSVKQMAAESSILETLYYPVYQLDSGWVHWDVGAIGQLLTNEGGRLERKLDRQSDEVSAMNVVFHSAWHLLYNCARWFGHPIKDQLSDIADAYARHGQALMAR